MCMKRFYFNINRRLTQLFPIIDQALGELQPETGEPFCKPKSI